MTVVKSEKLQAALKKILNDFAKKNGRVVATKISDMPYRFLREANLFYFQVLKIRTGRLRQSFKPISRQQGTDSWEIGLQSDVEYARIQHDGGQTKPHRIVPKNKKALYWPGARHPVKAVNHPGSKIRATKFFEKPMGIVVEQALKELKKEIGF